MITLQTKYDIEEQLGNKWSSLNERMDYAYFLSKSEAIVYLSNLVNEEDNDEGCFRIVELIFPRHK